jgi:hypothetical protein
MTAAQKLMTAEELARTSVPGKVLELVRGHLVVREPPSTLHGAVAANLTVELGAFVRNKRLGLVFAQDNGALDGEDVVPGFSCPLAAAFVA